MSNVNTVVKLLCFRNAIMFSSFRNSAANNRNRNWPDSIVKNKTTILVDDFDITARFRTSLNGRGKRAF